MQANRAYSARVASSIDVFLRDTQLRLGYSASRLSDRMDDPNALADELHRVQAQDNTFDNVAIIGPNRNVVAATPISSRLRDHVVESSDTVDALREQKPFVSDVHTSADGKPVVVVSMPIFARSGTYLGFLGGAINLQSDGVLGRLVSTHVFWGDSQVYIVDSRRTLLYHSTKSRVGSTIGENAAVDRSLEGRDGSDRITDSLGVDVLAGYAPIPTGHWGVASQQPVVSVLRPLGSMVYRTLIETVPLAILGMAVIWGLSVLISKPLRRLAESASNTGIVESATAIAGVNAWYFEASNIKRALLRSINTTKARVTRLELASHTDPLTGLLNRRAMDEALDEMSREERTFSAIALDIDHFKRVNDTFGHDIGDVVLQRLAALMREYSRDIDLACRVGGEEFTLLLPDASTSTAAAIGERLRQVVMNTQIDPVGHITISLGVATWPQDGAAITEVLKEADERMYAAKRAGRNRLVSASSNVA
ncbi:sensor domain-containing diguanylate cyclase [Pandoraea sp. B-6]|uniref:sensor domain-containing diguanylate cyclase n=1 Tax=Pandoraea sp. B-6 TaxID=1204340 RepID=UPI0018DED514|nr:sensor domain-containing diguanylate cyclase [Pandoraea sp. B-6]